MDMERELHLKGEFDYDYEHDILFFKAKNREYDRSIDLDGIVIDIDKDDYIVGMQIFHASEFLSIPKIHLRSVPRWKFMARLQDNRLEIRLVFQVQIRNKIIEKSPIIIERVRERLPNSQMVAVPV